MKHQLVRNKFAGRKYQRKMAKRFGGKSVGTIEGQDIEHPVFSMEAKKMKALPVWLIGEKKVKKKIINVGIWSQTLRNCPKGKIPIALIHVTGQRHEDDIVIMRLENFEALVDPKSMKREKTKLKREKRDR